MSHLEPGIRLLEIGYFGEGKDRDRRGKGLDSPEMRRKD